MTEKKLKTQLNNEQNVLLIIDDEKEVLNTLNRLFHRSYDVKVANNTDEAFKILEKSDVKVILCDQRMPDMNGTEFFQKIKDKYSNTLRILITGYANLDDVILAINKGDVYRYLTKPWNLAELKNTVEDSFDKARLIEANKRMIEELKSLNKHLEEKVQERTEEISKKNKQLEMLNHELERLATIDKLTGLRNRVTMESVFVEKVQVAKRLALDLVMIMVDMNNFKRVNDELGHAAGDELLKNFGSIMSANSRSGLDECFRIGGDEFLIIALDCNDQNAKRIVNTINTEFVKYTQISSLAYGIVEVDYKKDEAVEYWLTIADQRMYQNKRESKGDHNVCEL